MDRSLVTDEALAKIAGEFGAQKADDLFAAIGYGKITARAVLARLVGQEALRERPAERRRPPASSGASLGTGAASRRSRCAASTT